MRGFTLIELVVVLVIVTAMLGLALPMLGPISPGTRTEADVRAFAAFLRGARSDSIAGSRDVVVSLSTASGIYNQDEPRRSGRFASRAELAMTGAAVEQIDRTTGAIRFFPDGSSTGGEVRVTGAKASYRIAIEWLTGRIEVAP